VGDFQEQHFDEHLRLGTIQITNDTTDLIVSRIVRDDDQGSGLQINLDHGISQHRAAPILPRFGRQAHRASRPGARRDLAVYPGGQHQEHHREHGAAQQGNRTNG
jgi:hypothetical protein